MPHISKKALSKKDFQKIYDHFIKSFYKFKGKDSQRRFFWEFLTPTEKIMFSKRLAIIVLLERGISSYRIWKMLDVSSSTVERIGRRMDRGGYAHIALLFKKKDSQFLKIIETLVDIATPPPYHVSREKFLEYHRRQRQKDNIRR